jgi:hypothetical protein
VCCADQPSVLHRVARMKRLHGYWGLSQPEAQHAVHTKEGCVPVHGCGVQTLHAIRRDRGGIDEKAEQSRTDKIRKRHGHKVAEQSHASKRECDNGGGKCLEETLDPQVNDPSAPVF